MLRGRVDALMPQRLLRLANVPRGELHAHAAPDVMRLDVAQTDLIGIALYCTPDVDGWTPG